MTKETDGPTHEAMRKASACEYGRETDWDSIIGVPDVSTERWEELMEVYDGCLMADGFEEAQEYMDFNVLGAYVGEETPIFIGDYINEAS